MSASSPHRPLAYEPQTAQRLRSRRFAKAAFLASLLAISAVAWLLYAKLNAPLARHFRVWSAQQSGLSIPTAGRGLRWPASGSDRSGDTEFDRAVTRWASTFFVAPTSSLQALDTNFAYQTPDIVYFGPLRNQAGEQRLLALRIKCQSSTSGETPSLEAVGYAALIREKVHLLRYETAVPNPSASGTLLANVDARSLTIDPPQLDPRNDRRLLITGAMDSRPFEFELFLDAKDRVRLFRLDAEPNASASTSRDPAATAGAGQ